MTLSPVYTIIFNRSLENQSIFHPNFKDFPILMSETVAT